MRVRHAAVSMSALVIGAITPDFEYFLKLELESTISHTAMGIFILDIPIAVTLFFLFHMLLKAPLIDYSPAYFRSRLQSLRLFEASRYWHKHYIAFLVCIFIGILSHLLWDGLTHEKDLIVQKLDFFRAPVEVEGMPTYPVFRYFQHLSTLFGAIIIAVVFHRSEKAEVDGNAGTTKFWLILVSLTIVIFLARAYFHFDYFGDVVVSVIGAFFWATVMVSSLYRFRSDGKKEDVGTGREAKG